MKKRNTIVIAIIAILALIAVSLIVVLVFEQPFAMAIPIAVAILLPCVFIIRLVIGIIMMSEESEKRK